MIICTNVSNSRPGPDGVYLVAELQAITKPDPMPLTGAGIGGMRAEELLDAGSRLLVLADGGTEWILGQDWTWYAQAQSGGGGDTPCDDYKALDPLVVYEQTRPGDWLPMPEPEEDEAWMLWHIAKDASAAVGIYGSGSAYDVTLYSMQDGVLTPFRDTEHIDANSDWVYRSGDVKASEFDEDDETLTSGGLKQVLIKVSASAGGHLTGVWLYSGGSSEKIYVANKYNIVEISDNLPECPSGSAYYDGVEQKLLCGRTRYFSIRSDKPVSASNMFEGAVSLVAVLDFPAINGTAGVAAMFSGCYSLRAIPLLDTSNVKSMYQMFYDCASLEAIPQLDTSNATNMVNMFFGCRTLKAIPPFDTSNVTSMAGMFSDCASLETIPPLDTSKVKNMGNMFYKCYSLKAIPPLDTQNVTDMSNMFLDCKSLEGGPLLDTSNVKSMSGMFQNCASLKTIPPLDTSKVNTSNTMFYNCVSLSFLPPIDTQHMSNMSGMFNSCSALAVIPAIDTSAIPSGGYFGNVFNNCAALQKLRMNPNAVKIYSFSIYGCNLGHDAMIDLFESLPAASASVNITITGNPGADGLLQSEIAIATDKGYTVVGATNIVDDSE